MMTRIIACMRIYVYESLYVCGLHNNMHVGQHLSPFVDMGNS